jgi:hypothetical protein
MSKNTRHCIREYFRFLLAQQSPQKAGTLVLD